MRQESPAPAWAAVVTQSECQLLSHAVADYHDGDATATAESNVVTTTMTADANPMGVVMGSSALVAGMTVPVLGAPGLPAQKAASEVKHRLLDYMVNYLALAIT